MSYMIVYDRQAIKTKDGYILTVLSGDNNVWDPGNRSRAKHWSCWSFDKTKDEIESYFSGFCKGQDGEHFMSNGKFLNDKALMKWIKNSLQNAKTIEEIRLLKPCISICCFCYVVDNSKPDSYFKREMSEYIHSTQELNAWVQEVRNRLQTKAWFEDVQPVVSIGGDKGAHLNGKTVPKGRVVAKVGKDMFVTGVDSYGQWTRASGSKKGVKVFGNIYEATKQLRASGPGIEFVAFEDFLKKGEKKKEYMIEVESKAGCPRGYYYRGTRSGFQYTGNEQKAKKFDKSGAEAAMKRLAVRRFEDTVFKIVKEKEE